MAILNKSQTEKQNKDYWRTSELLINDALKLLNIKSFGIEHLKSKFEAEEGFCPVDGSSGIEIIDYYWSGLDDSVITITEVNYE